MTNENGSPEMRIIESIKRDGDEDKNPVLKVCKQSSASVGGGNLEEGELVPRKDTQKHDTVPTHEYRSFPKGELRTPSSKSCLGPPRRIPSLDLPHLSARQSPCGLSDAEKSPVLSKVSTASYSRHTDQGIVGMSSTPTSMFPSVRKRNLPMGYNTAPFSPGQFENQQPPIKIAASGPWFNPLQTADILHRSLQDFPRVSRQKSSYIHTHDTHHLFNCTHIRTTLSPLDLWTDLAGVTALLARWTEMLAGGPQAGTSDSPH